MRLPILICALAAIPAAAQTMPAVPVWTVSAKPTLEIGDDADPRKQFTRIGSVARLSDGSIVVANGESQELRLFSARGEYLRALSSKGSGPGELRMLHTFHLAGDTIVVPEAQPGEAVINTYSPSGFIGRVQLKSPGWGGITVVGRFPDGRLVVTPGFRVMPELPVGTMVTDTIRVGTMLLDASAAPEWIGSFPSRQIWLIDSPFVPGRPFPVDFWFGRQVAYAVSGDRLWVGDSETGRVIQFGSTGAKVGEIQLPTSGRDFRGDVLERVRTSRLAEVPVDNKMQRAMVEGLYKAPRPKRVPLFTQFIAGSRGEMWVRMFDEDPAGPPAYLVVDRNGRAVARANLPRGFAVHQIGSDFVLGVRRDDDGVEHVASYALQRR